jgi:hypothetical protein
MPLERLLNREVVYNAGALDKMDIASFPRQLEGSELSGLNGLRYKLFRQLALPELVKHTGLEGLSMSDFMQIADRRNIFRRAKIDSTFLFAKWNSLILAIYSGSKKRNKYTPLYDLLYSQVARKPLLEIGVGDNYIAHRRIFVSRFKVSSYEAIDRNKPKSGKVLHVDALRYLSELPENSTNVVAFGVFNEPLAVGLGDEYGEHSFLDFLWPASDASGATNRQCEYEYLRRLAREIYRVVPEGGILIGKGLHPVGQNPDFNQYLLTAGFTVNQAFREKIHSLVLEETENYGHGSLIPYYDAFFLQKGFHI